MKSRTKLLAITGSQRKDANCYLLIKAVLESAGVDYEIVQLAEKKIEFCSLCEKCIDNDCVLEDDLNGILEKMEKADGIVFAFPKYIFTASKFLCFMERLDTIRHMHTHGGYQITRKNPDYKMFSKEKPFCIFALSGTGKFEKQTLKTVAECIQDIGLKLIPHDRRPFVGVIVKSGDVKGGVLKNKKAVNECKRLVERLVNFIAA